MNINTIVFDLGFTLLTFENFTLTRYVKTLDKGLDQLIGFLEKENILTHSENFRKNFKKIRNKNFERSLLSYEEIPTEETLNQTFESLHMPKLEPPVLHKAALIYHSTEGAFWKFRPSVKPVLQELKEDGYKLGILSNAPFHQGIISLLETHRIAQYFDEITTSAQIGFCKPDERAFSHILTQLKSEPIQSVMVGDDLKNDIQGAKKMGMRTILIKKNFVFPSNSNLNIIPDFEILDLPEIPPIIRKWNSN